MTNIRLSIIIPFYNVEKYIAECLDSVYNQDIPEEEYEVICVNDASPDHSRDIVLEYQKKHSNLILVEHEMNKKLGAARNTGRKVARGRYIWNMDSDDMIAPNCLGEILETCDKNDLDVMLFSFKRLEDGELQERGIEPWIESDYVYTGLTFWRQQVIRKQAEISPVWTQVYRSAYLDENEIYSPEINMGEDVPYTYDTILRAKRMMACNRPFYVYRHNMASLSAEVREAPTPNTLYENCFGCGKLLFELIQFISPIENEIRQSIINISRAVVLEHLSIFPKMGADAQKNFVSLCRKGVWQSRYLFRLFNHRQKYQYLKFMFLGRI